MYLKNLSNPSKAFFLELAVLLLMVKQKKKLQIQDHEDGVGLKISEPLLASFWATIEPIESGLLQQQAQALNIGYFVDDFLFEPVANELYIENLQKGLPQNYKLHEMASRLFNQEYETLYGEELQSGDVKFTYLKKVMLDAVQDILAEYGQNTALRQEIMQAVVENGSDIFQLSPEMIQKVTISLPSIHKMILDKTLVLLMDTKDKSGYVFSLREKKIILSELIKLLIANHRYEEFEKELIGKICTEMVLDSDYVYEFEDVLHRLIKVEEELITLINE